MMLIANQSRVLHSEFCLVLIPVSPMRLITRQVQDEVDPRQPFTPTEWEERTTEQLSEVWEFIRNHQRELAQRMKQRYDKNRKDLELEPGDLVLLSTKSHHILLGHRKHKERFVGPYVVHKKVNDNAYQLTGLPDAVPRTQNVRHLRLFRPSPEKFRTRPTPSANVPDLVDGEFQWEVAEILDSKTTGSGIWYSIQWANSPQQQWLRLESMDGCLLLLREYYEKNNLPIPERVQKFIEDNSARVINDDENHDENREVIENNRGNNTRVVYTNVISDDELSSDSEDQSDPSDDSNYVG